MSEAFTERDDPEAVFALLSDETRIDILRELRAAGETAYSDLRQQVGLRDSGQFNYHLDRLTGQFVTKTDAGYALTQAGKEIVGALASGNYTMDGTLAPVTLDDPCRRCGGTQTFQYADGLVHVDCEDCTASATSGVPPAVLAGRDAAAMPRAANRYLRQTIRHATEGLCWYCNGTVETKIAPVDDLDAVDARDDALWATYACQRCTASGTAGLDVALLAHPAVAGFYYDHGIDVRDRLIWAFPATDAVDVSVASRDPPTATVSYTEGDETLTLAVDNTLAVTGVERDLSA